MKLSNKLITAALLLSIAFGAGHSVEAATKLQSAQTTLSQAKTTATELSTQRATKQAQLTALVAEQTELSETVRQQTEQLQEKNNQLADLQRRSKTATLPVTGSGPSTGLTETIALLKRQQIAKQVTTETTELKSEQAELRYELARNQGELSKKEQTTEKLSAELKELAAKQTTTEQKITEQTVAVEKLTAEEKAQAEKTAQAKAAAEKAAAEQAAKVQATGFASPLAGSLNVSSGFGSREDPTGASGTQHDGIDFTGDYGQTVMAARTGVVEQTGTDPSAGNYVIIKHDNGYYSYYMHLSAITATTGQTISIGQTVGQMGSTGNSTGVHLHFGLSKSVWSDFVDPAAFLGV